MEKNAIIAPSASVFMIFALSAPSPPPGNFPVGVTLWLCMWYSIGTAHRIFRKFVEFQETVTSVSSQPVMSKSPNRHNRLWMTAEPISEELCQAIEDGEMNTGETIKLRDLASVLVSKFEWSKQEASKLWCFRGTNCLVESCQGVQYLQEIKEHVIAAFNWMVSESVLAGEPMHGVRINLVDAMLHADAIHRGGGQIIPSARKCISLAMLSAKPALLEPVFLAEIVTDREAASKIHPLIMRLRGYVTDEQPKEGSPLLTVKAHIPVLESFGFSASLRGATGGRAFPQLLFSHWQPVSGDPTNPASNSGQLVKKTRERRRMVPLASTIEDLSS
eukprot:TRINITY_DN9903_c0_g1_i2.p1 TRINITY_DN9903_c0_g1~~TRINITY_DN9903_c0_g1_i2.p1  ORF type:complete len:332 (-),score=45.21 TRINITY_DN9903_c0_g1_i2:23-1018(-)